MFKNLKINLSKVYPTLVVATMSSGKSTLINALVGKELLPSRNSACTARSIAILDNDTMPSFIAHTVTEGGEYIKLTDVSRDAVERFNETNSVSEMILEGQIRGIKNSKKALFLVDTPGINNALTAKHGSETERTLEEYGEGLILYVINAAQIGTYDDYSFMMKVAGKLSKDPNFRILFAVNKMDEIDPEKEDIHELISNCKKYIEDNGIADPIIIPTAAEAALLFKKALGGDPFTKMQVHRFREYYELFRDGSYSLVNFANTAERGDLTGLCRVENETYTRAEIYQALYNTGVTYLETVIDEMLVKSLKMKSPRISFKSDKSKNDPKRKSKKK